MKKRLLNRQATLEYLEHLKGAPGKAAGVLPPPRPGAGRNAGRRGARRNSRRRPSPHDVAGGGFENRLLRLLECIAEMPGRSPFSHHRKTVPAPRYGAHTQTAGKRVRHRAGAGAPGILRRRGFQRGKAFSQKVERCLVHGRHRQGGSSSHRFERHRDKQIETFLNRVCEHVQETIVVLMSNSSTTSSTAAPAIRFRRRESIAPCFKNWEPRNYLPLCGYT